MEFFKILWNNVIKGPITEAFPLGEAETPARFRGKVAIDPELCVGCGICRHMCAAGAINITARPDHSGYDIVIWHNSCCLCGQCRHYCPTKAASLSKDWHNAHRSDKKYAWVEHQYIPYQTCAQCGALQRFLPPAVTARLYEGMTELEKLPQFGNLCVTCRMIAVAVAEERACHIDPPAQPAGADTGEKAGSEQGNDND
jgi:formate hydrogenlyase subunit 6/NADH:ubiquinone oxidoreductase subunit I